MDEPDKPGKLIWVKVTKFRNPDGSRCEADSFLNDGVNTLPDLSVEIQAHWEKDGEGKKFVVHQLDSESTKARRGDTDGVVRWIIEPRTKRRRPRFFPNKG